MLAAPPRRRRQLLRLRRDVGGLFEFDPNGKWASLICYHVTGLRHLAITKRDPSARMPSESFGTLFFLFCPCPFPLSVCPRCSNRRNGGAQKRIGGCCFAEHRARRAPPRRAAPIHGEPPTTTSSTHPHPRRAHPAPPRPQRPAPPRRPPPRGPWSTARQRRLQGRPWRTAGTQYLEAEGFQTMNSLLFIASTVSAGFSRS